MHRVTRSARSLSNGSKVTGGQCARRLFSRPARVVAPAAIQLIGPREAAVGPRPPLVRRVRRAIPVPRHVVRLRQLIEIAANGEPVVLGRRGQLLALHEAVDADAASEHLVDIGGDHLMAVEVIAQVVRRVGEVLHELVDARAS